MSNDALISTLTANLAPVRRRSAAREGALIAALGVLELALFLGLGAMRPDMGAAIGHPFMWWKLGSLALLAAIGVSTAVYSFAPTASPRRGLAASGIVGTLALIASGLIDPGSAAGATLAERLSPVHGLMCAVCIVVLALPMLGVLSLLMRRGAPTHPEGSAVAVGLAAGTWGAFVFAFCCPANDPLYVAAWYLAGCAVVTGAARYLLARGFRL